MMDGCEFEAGEDERGLEVELERRSPRNEPVQFGASRSSSDSDWTRRLLR